MAYEYKTNAQNAYKKKAKAGKINKELCQKRWYGKACKTCQQVAHLSQGDEDDKNIAYKVKAKSTYYMNVIPMIKGGSKIADKTIKIYPSGIKNWKEMVALLPDNDGDGVDFTDPDNMRPIIMDRTGKGRSTTYTVKLAENSIKLPESFLAKMFGLHKLLDWLDDDDKFFIPEEGKNKFLVLPPWGQEANGEFWFEGFFHWNTDLLGAADDGFEDSGSGGKDDSFTESAESSNESFSDDDFEESGEKDESFDDSGSDDDFEEFDETEKNPPSLDEMGKEALVAMAADKNLKLSEKALAAPVEKLRAYMKKKLEDIPW